MPVKNSVTASQARAARRREARRDEQAVAAWLRELAGPRAAADRRAVSRLRRG